MRNRPRSLRILIITAILSIGLCADARALISMNDFSRTSPRIIAMGGAYVAIADDAGAVFYNPAGLADLDDNTLLADYGTLLGDVRQYSFVGSAKLGDLGGIGIGYNLAGFEMPGTIIDPEGKTTSAGTDSFYDGDIAVSYGYPVCDWFLLGAKIHRTFSGMGFPIYSSGTIQQENIIGEAYGLDVGILMRLKENLSFGLLVGNASKTEFKWDRGAREKLPTSIITGLAYQPVPDRALLALELQSENIEQNSGIDNLSLGSELEPIRNCKIRFGYRFDRDSSSDNYSPSGSMGLGIKFLENFWFDYAWQRQQNYWADNQYFSLGCKF